jgi:hypothetical protein
MALSDSAFAAALKDIFAQMRDGSKNDDWLAEKLAKAVDDQIKTAEVNTGIAVTGGTASGGPLVGASTSAKGSLS